MKFEDQSHHINLFSDQIDIGHEKVSSALIFQSMYTLLFQMDESYVAIRLCQSPGLGENQVVERLSLHDRAEDKENIAQDGQTDNEKGGHVSLDDNIGAVQGYDNHLIQVEIVKEPVESFSFSDGVISKYEDHWKSVDFQYFHHAIPIRNDHIGVPWLSNQLISSNNDQECTACIFQYQIRLLSRSEHNQGIGQPSQ